MNQEWEKIRDEFFQRRHNPSFHLGCGDIRLTLADQVAIAAMVEDLQRYSAHEPPADQIAAIETIEQALREVQHAQSVGANWYTRGASGLYQQVSMWVRKGQEAAKALRAAQPPPVTHIALLEVHGRNSFLHAADFRAVIVPPGQSLDFDEGPGASRRWLHPYLGNTHHLVSFIEVATSTKESAQ